MPQSPQQAAPGAATYLVTSLAPLFFSTNLIFGRMVVPDVAPFTLAFIRWFSVALALAPFALRERAAVREALSRRALLILLLGFLGMWICGAMVYLGLRWTTATNAVLITTTSPMFMVVLEAIFLGAAIGLRQVAGSVLALAGVAVIVLRGQLSDLIGFSFSPGDLLVLLGAVSWAGYSILYRDEGLRRLPNLSLFCLVAAAGALLLAPFSIAEMLSGAPMPVTRQAWTGIAGIVLISSLLAFSTFQYGIRRIGASTAGVFMYLMPVYGVLLAVFALGEVLHAYHAVGIGLVMAGVVMATLPARRPPATGAQPSVASPGNVSSSQ